MTKILLPIVMLVVTGSCRTPANERRFPIAGKVVDVAADHVTLDHEPVDGVMPAMVMDLSAPPETLRTLVPGDRVTATLVLDNVAGTRLEQVLVVGHVEPAPRAERWHDSLMVGEVLEPVRVETVNGWTTVGAGQGRVTVLTFLFTRCPLPEFCPLLSSKLAAVQSEIGGARIVAVSLDPEHDTPALLAEYGERFGADPAVWSLGRVPPAELAALLERVDVEVTPEGGTLSHNLRLLVLDADGRLVQRIKDNGWEVGALAATVRSVGSGPVTPE